MAQPAGTSANLNVVKLIYWALREDWSTKKTLHLLGVLFGFAMSYCKVWILRTTTLRNKRLVAIALTEHLGDIVAAEPISRAARRLFPDSQIFWICRKAYAEIPASYPDVERVLTVHCLTEWLMLRNTPLFDRVLDLHLSGRICSSCQIPISKEGASSRITQRTYYEYGNLLTVQCLCAGIPPIQDKPRLRPGPTAVRKVDRLHLPATFVAIHCTANEPSRDWEPEKWSKLISHLTQGLDLAVVEIGLEPVVASADGSHVINLCGKLSIMETAELIRRARLFVGIDSGPAHLANAVGTEGVILLGQYREFQRQMPYSGDYEVGKRADLLRAAGAVAGLTVETVISAVSRRLARV